MPLLSKLKSLKSLNLMGTEITDEGLKAIDEPLNLERLNLKSCWIEGHGLRHLDPVEKPEGTGFGSYHAWDRN